MKALSRKLIQTRLLLIRLKLSWSHTYHMMAKNLEFYELLKFSGNLNKLKLL